MLSLFKTNIGRLRILGFLEGFSLLILLFVAMPLKYVWHYPEIAKWTGTVHGALFLLFVFNTFSVAIQLQWPFTKITWKVLAGSFLPFGTFYIDRKILRAQKGD